MVTFSSIISAPAASSSSTSSSSSKTPAADKALGQLMQSPAVLQYLASLATSRYQPPTDQQMMAGLWTSLDANGRGKITRADVQQALAAVNVTGTPPLDALWAQIDPNNTASISEKDFGGNQYLSQTLPSLTSAVQTSVKQTLLTQGASTNTGTLFDNLNSSPGSVMGGTLDFLT